MAKSSVSKEPFEAVPSLVPRGERRRQEIVTVAEQVFLASGFSDTTMQMVAVKACASKETLYRHFGSKEGLFAEVVGIRARRLLMRLDAEIERPSDIAAVLRDLGVTLLEIMTSPEVISLMRIVVAEAPRDPGLGRIFYAIGPERTRLRLTEYLTAARTRGEFLGSHPGLAASIFLGAITAQSHIERLLLRDPPAMSRDEIRERVGEVVAMFLLRYVRNGGTKQDPATRA